MIKSVDSSKFHCRTELPFKINIWHNDGLHLFGRRFGRTFLLLIQWHYFIMLSHVLCEVNGEMGRREPNYNSTQTADQTKNHRWWNDARLKQRVIFKQVGTVFIQISAVCILFSRNYHCKPLLLFCDFFMFNTYYIYQTGTWYGSSSETRRQIQSSSLQ